jgi:hypothetical protein
MLLCFARDQKFSELSMLPLERVVILVYIHAVAVSSFESVWMVWEHIVKQAKLVGTENVPACLLE